eukprot:TRINITY_DN17039_c1_g2_i2.p2 TRINITY_DN17039_c1_g2~~TRINITY_DN17039_c1_g2_i2.p2  ORF type:complete len:115 (-),score=10.21 TRINITY_DN17039_c1_g2_i2:563-907(-)
MKSDEPVGGVWRFPTYTEGRYDKKCLIQCAIAECFGEMQPLPMVLRDEVVAGGHVRDIRTIRQRGAATRHSTEPPGRFVKQFPTADVAMQVVHPPLGAKPATMRPRCTSRVSRR